jgi:hypothetical protein
VIRAYEDIGMRVSYSFALRDQNRLVYQDDKQFTESLPVELRPAMGRDETGEQALAVAFDKGGAERVTRLYRRDDLPEDQCWLRAPGWCLAYR